MDDGSTREEQRSNNLDNIHYCLNEGCEGTLEEVDGNHEDLKVEFACSNGCRDAKCVTELAWN
jgi:hypothetical protein